MVREITEQLRNERAVAEASAELSTVFETVPVGLALFDQNLALVRMNGLLASWHGVDQASMRGRHPRELFPQLWPRAAEQYARALAGEQGSLEFAPSLLRGAGAPEAVSRTYSPVVADGQVAGVVVTVTDISSLVDRERLAGQAARLREEVMRLASHEIRTPLTVLVGLAQRLERVAIRRPDMMMGDSTEDLSLVRAEAERLARTLDTITSTIDLEDGRLDLEIDSVLLRPLVERAVRIVSERHQDFNVETFVPSSAVVHSDGDRILQIVLNLLENAAKYGGGRASIRVEQDDNEGGGWVGISVIDNGPGIPAEDVERIFERGYRGSTSSRASGSGLGLHYARALAAALGGSLELRATQEPGARFKLRLPLVMSIAEAG